MGEWLITISAASVILTVLHELAGTGGTGRTAVFVTGAVFAAIGLEATKKLLGV